MRIWLIQIAEPLQSDGEDVRLLRTGILADMLADRGHEVLWWTSTFNHYMKVHRYRSDTVMTIRPRLRIRFLKGTGYKKNFSLMRWLDHSILTAKFRRQIHYESPPDLILSSLPTPDLCLAAVKMGQQAGVPVIIDGRDMWPDVIMNAIPQRFGWIKTLIAQRLVRVTRKAFQGADAILGITPAFVRWGLAYAGREATELDRFFSLSYKPPSVDRTRIDHAVEMWKARGVGVAKSEFNVCFFGNLASRDAYEFEMLVTAARSLMQREPRIRFIICGDGVDAPYYKKIAAGCNNILFPGWVNASAILSLMSVSALGIIPYKNRQDFQSSYPNKTGEYLSGGLPIASSISGEYGRLLEDNNCGFVYQDAKSLEEGLLRFVNEPSILKQASQNALSLYRGMFSAENVYADMIAHLELIAKSYQKVHH